MGGGGGQLQCFITLVRSEKTLTLQWEYVPALSENDGRQSGKQIAEEAIECPPCILQDQSPEDNEPTERVINEHNLTGPTENPIQNLKKDKLPSKLKEEHII